MHDFWGQISGPLIDGLALIITVLLGLGLGALKRYINARVTNEDLKTDLLKTETVLGAGVRSLIAGMSAESKKALADGTLSKEEMDELQKKAESLLKAQVPDVEDRLKVHINNSSQYLADMISGEFEKANKVTGVQ